MKNESNAQCLMNMRRVSLCRVLLNWYQWSSARPGVRGDVPWSSNLLNWILAIMRLNSIAHPQEDSRIDMAQNLLYCHLTSLQVIQQYVAFQQVCCAPACSWHWPLAQPAVIVTLYRPDFNCKDNLGFQCFPIKKGLLTLQSRDLSRTGHDEGIKHRVQTSV